MNYKLVNITYSNETPDSSLLWLHLIILKILIKELNLDPVLAGDLIRTSNRSLKLMRSPNLRKGRDQKS